MTRLHVALPESTSASILSFGHFGIMLLLATLFASPSATALPPASGSKCSSNWVNNDAAMSCFIQGEEDVRNGVAHPHYVACTAAGEVFCCVDKGGGQDCEAVSISVGGHGRPNIGNVHLRAMLESQRTVTTLLGQVSANLDKLASSMADRKIADGNRTASANIRAAEEAAVRAASAEWAKVAAAKDLEKTLSYYAEDASMFAPNMPVVTGPEARRKLWTGLLAEKDLVFSNAATKVEVSASGDLAYETGMFQESFTDNSGKPAHVIGKYVVVWKKQASGQWKAIVDAFNTDQ